MQLDQVISWYQSERQWAKLKESSREVYAVLLRQGIDTLITIKREQGNPTRMSSITARDADKLYDELWNAFSPHKATSVCTVLRRVWAVAKRYERVKSNPFEKMDLTATNRRTTVWDDEQVNDFVAASVNHGEPSIGLLLTLCYELGQRPGDMRMLKWSAYNGVTMTFTQQKTNKDMCVSVPEPLQWELEQVEKTSPYIVVRPHTNHPYTADDYQPVYRAVRKLAMLPDDLQLRDARRSAITQAAEGGATDSELQALGGHDQRKMLNVYQVNTPKLSENAQTKRNRR